MAEHKDVTRIKAILEAAEKGLGILEEKYGIETVGEHSEPDGETFWRLLSGKVEYSQQCEAWECLCRAHGADGLTVLGLLNRAHTAARSAAARKQYRKDGAR